VTPAAPSAVHPRRRVALINSIVERNDAISANVRDMARALGEGGCDVTVFCCKSDYPELRAVVVGGVVELVTDERFRKADLLIWHFGIFYELFNAVVIGSGGAPQVVCFHNITPKEFLSETSWPLLERSLVQAHLMAAVDEVWAVSDLNAACARQFGVAEGAIRTIPLIVDDNPRSRLRDKATEPINILFVGRFVRSKGVADLLEAVESLRARGEPRFKVALVGNVAFSDDRYLQNLRDYIRDKELEELVEFHGAVDDETLYRFYREAHILAIPSYHEGFCKPVVEGLRAGCIPIGYASYNLPYVVNGLGRLVKPGDVAALAVALRDVTAALPTALQLPSRASFPLDCGPISIETFEARSELVTRNFERANVSWQISERVSGLMPH